MIQGNPDIDFLEQNPLLRYKDFFVRLLQEYPKEFSKIAWTLQMLEDPESPFYNAPHDIRKKEIHTNYCPELDWDIVEKHRDGFVRATMAKEKILYKIAYDKLEDLTMNLRSKDLEDEKEWKQTVLLLDKLDKLWASMDALKTKYAESQFVAKVRGGGAESARERRGG